MAQPVPNAPGAPQPAPVDPNLIGREVRAEILNAPGVSGVAGPLVVRFTDASGTPIDDYESVHTAQMHVFSETTGEGASTTIQDFQHVHPPQYLGNGTWRLPEFTWHVAGTQHLVANFVSNGVNTVASTSVDVASGPTPAAPPTDLSYGYTATFASGGTGVISPSSVRIAVRDPSGSPIAGNDDLFGANAHLVLFDPREGGSAGPGFAHGHALNPAHDGTFDIDMGVLGPGTYQGYLQFRPVGGEPTSVPITIPWTGRE